MDQASSYPRHYSVANIGENRSKAHKNYGDRLNQMLSNPSEIVRYLIMESAKQSARVEFNEFVFNITNCSDQKIHLNVVSKTSGLVYEEKNLALTRLNYTAVIDALRGTRKELKASTNIVDCDGFSVLQLNIHFEHHLLPSFTEVLACKKTKELGENELLKNGVIRLKSKIDGLRDKVGELKQSRFVGSNTDTIKCKSAQDVIAEVTVNKGTYLITVSYMASVTNQWIYVYLNHNKPKLIDQQGYYLPMSNVEFYPAVLRTVMEIPQDQFCVKFSVAHANSYPATITNTIITAQLLSV